MVAQDHGMRYVGTRDGLQQWRIPARMHCRHPAVQLHDGLKPAVQ